MRNTGWWAGQGFPLRSHHGVVCAGMKVRRLLGNLQGGGVRQMAGSIIGTVKDNADGSELFRGSQAALVVHTRCWCAPKVPFQKNS